MLAEVAGVARENKIEFWKKNILKKIWFLKKKNFDFFSLCYPKVPIGSLKKFSQFGLDVWPAIANLYTDKQIYNYISIRAKIFII